MPYTETGTTRTKLALITAHAEREPGLQFDAAFDN